ncbi:MAG: NVEALA domain-containing protein [Tannerella sp.]|nr:NVEALA domain-containing protein [Tannerella sp.]
MSKKNFFGLSVVLVVAAIAVFNVNVNAWKESLSDVSLENVEALANEILPQVSSVI